MCLIGREWVCCSQRVKTGGVLSVKRIDHFQKRETVKVGIASEYLPDAMLSHEDGCVRVVQQVAREMRVFFENLLGDHHVSLGRHQNAEAR